MTFNQWYFKEFPEGLTPETRDLLYKAFQAGKGNQPQQPWTDRQGGSFDYYDYSTWK